MRRLLIVLLAKTSVGEWLGRFGADLTKEIMGKHLLVIFGEDARESLEHSGCILKPRDGDEANSMSEQSDEFTIPAGTVLKIRGFPVQLCADAKVFTHPDNYKLLLSQSEQFCGNPTQVEGLDT